MTAVSQARKRGWEQIASGSWTREDYDVVHHGRRWKGRPGWYVFRCWPDPYTPIAGPYRTMSEAMDAASKHEETTNA